MLSYYQLFLLDISSPENSQVRNCRCLSVKMSLTVTLVTNQNAVAIHTTCILSQPRSFLVYFFQFWGLCCEKEEGLKRAPCKDGFTIYLLHCLVFPVTFSKGLSQSPAFSHCKSRVSTVVFGRYVKFCLEFLGVILETDYGKCI